MKRDPGVRLIAGFAVFTLALTWGVIIVWELWLQLPFYRWVETHFPADRGWLVQEGTEHFLISAVVDLVVVTMLLRIVRRQRRGLRLSEQRYHALFEHANDGIGVLASATGKFVEVNTRLTEILGYGRQDLVGRSLCELVVRDPGVPAPDDAGSLLGLKPSAECTIRMRTADGNSLPVCLSMSRLPTDADDLIVLIVHDLTERERAEEELGKLSSAIRQTADSVVITDRKGIIEYVNPAFELLSGYSAQEAVGGTFRMVNSGKHPKEYFQRLWETVLAGEVYRNILVNRKKSGELYWEEQTVTPLIDSRGNITHFVVTGKDITERKKAEEALRDSEERYRLLFHSNPFPMWVFDRESLLILDVNQAAIDKYGYPRDEFLSMSIADIRPPEDVPRLLENLSKSPCGIDYAGEWRHRKKDGTIMDVEITSHAINVGGRPAEIVLPRDITERKRLEAEKEEMQRQLFQSSKLASIGELSAGVAHEIGNPVNSIINFGQLLKDYGVARNATERQVIEGIIEEGGRIAAIVRDLLTFARRDSTDLTRIHLEGAIHTSLSIFGRQLTKDGVAVELDIPEYLPPVLAAGSLLRQVIVNMITNAHHALKGKPEESRIFRISARAVRQEQGEVVRIEFFDTGVGISRENLDKIFDPFFTTRRDSGGTGLGLSLSFGIIRNYGGTITVESEEGRYTRFKIELPVAGSWETVNA